MNDKEAFAALVRSVPGWLDRPIEDLVKLQAVGSVYLDTHRSMLKKIKSGQIGLAEEDRKSRLSEGQAIGRALLDVEARIGELLPPVEETNRLKGGDRHTLGGKSRRVLPEGITGKNAWNARTIARHPEAVKQVIAEAEENEDIPTKTAVLNRIKADRYKAAQEASKVDTRKTRFEMSIEERQYIMAMENAYRKLGNPPREWTERFFNRAKELASMIAGRIKPFLEE